MQSNKDMENKIHRIAIHYGPDSQLDQTIEELAELTVAIRKFIRFKENSSRSELVNLFYNLTEEVADVEIMLEQLKYLFPIVAVDVEKIKIEKLDRQIKRIGVCK